MAPGGHPSWAAEATRSLRGPLTPSRWTSGLCGQVWELRSLDGDEHPDAPPGLLSAPPRARRPGPAPGPLWPPGWGLAPGALVGPGRPRCGDLGRPGAAPAPSSPGRPGSPRPGKARGLAGGPQGVGCRTRVSVSPGGPLRLPAVPPAENGTCEKPPFPCPLLSYAPHPAFFFFFSAALSIPGVGLALGVVPRFRVQVLGFFFCKLIILELLFLAVLQFECKSYQNMD